MASLPTLSDGIALTHFIVAEDVERAARFYSDVLGGERSFSPASRRSSRSRTAGSSSTSAADPQTTSRASFSSRHRIRIA